MGGSGHLNPIALTVPIFGSVFVKRCHHLIESVGRKVPPHHSLNI
jgi:hypothetical protein